MLHRGTGETTDPAAAHIDKVLFSKKGMFYKVSMGVLASRASPPMSTRLRPCICETEDSCLCWEKEKETVEGYVCFVKPEPIIVHFVRSARTYGRLGAWRSV